MLKLRRAWVTSTAPLEVRLDGSQETRRAWADESLVGSSEVGDEVIVNVEALDLGLGSGGFDVVHANLTRGLSAAGSAGEHVMKLNYTSLQHPVKTIEREEGTPRQPTVPVLAIGLHGHLAPAAWAAAEAGADGIGYVQTGGGALPGSLSRDVAELLHRGLIAGHLTAGPSFGGREEAITLVGAIDAAAALGWNGVIAGPGPGILGSGTAYGHGGMVALDVIHSGLALGAKVLLSPRLSAGDPRPRHQGLSHHSRSVLDLALGAVELPVPSEFLDLIPEDMGGVRSVEVDLEGYAGSGLPRKTMGRDLDEDRPFFAGPLAAGTRLGQLIAEASV
jgi:hypothetical protein